MPDVPIPSARITQGRESFSKSSTACRNETRWQAPKQCQRFFTPRCGPGR